MRNMIRKIRNLDPVYHILYCIFIVFLYFLYIVFSCPATEIQPTCIFLFVLGASQRAPFRGFGGHIRNRFISMCRVPNYRLIRPFPQCHLPKLKFISAEALP